LARGTAKSYVGQQLRKPTGRRWLVGRFAALADAPGSQALRSFNRWAGGGVNRLSGWLLIAPAIILLLVFKVYPILATFPESLVASQGFGTPEHFVGLSNYLTLVRDSDFWRATANTVAFVVITTIGVNAFGFFLALLVSRRRLRFKGLFQTILFLPVVVSLTASAVLWGFLMDPYVGLVPPLLQYLHLAWLVPSTGFFGTPTSAMLTISAIAIWQAMGFFMVIYLSGLQTIDADLFDAAKVDGANSGQTLWRITLPLMRPFISIGVTLAIIGGFGVFDWIYILTGGGPAHATESLMTYMYFQAFTQFDQGYASAIIVAILVLTAIASYLQWRQRYVGTTAQ
jgi:ABC-type sugar transport system permease subunit